MCNTANRGDVFTTSPHFNTRCPQAVARYLYCHDVSDTGLTWVDQSLVVACQQAICVLNNTLQDGTSKDTKDAINSMTIKSIENFLSESKSQSKVYKKLPEHLRLVDLSNTSHRTHFKVQCCIP